MRFWPVLAGLLVAAATAEEKKDRPEEKGFERCDGATPSNEAACWNIPEIMQLQTSACQPYHIILSRGTDEKAPGRLGNLTRLFCDKLGGKENCGWESVDYPAKNRFLSDTTWCESADIGAQNGQKQIREYVEKCPDTKLILIGYSQGASITQDMLGGGGGPIFKCTQKTNPPLDRTIAPGKNIAAAVSFGTVRRVSGASYAVKSGKNYKSEGARSDEQRAALDKWADVLRDYCHENDPICASNSPKPDLHQHLTYMSIHTEEIVNWVVRTVDGKTPKHVEPLLHQLSKNRYWMTSALMVSLVLTWTALFCFTSMRRRVVRGY